ncbi:MAG: toxin-antitoxin system toxin component, PIN family protein [Anaerolineae bacterium]|nr:PIN domain-containing protein [Anaerolineales bacterium]MCQ3979297.1 toxin-antitoxin system toxin component, PIN family protein [Anaerolineae bacterium]
MTDIFSRPIVIDTNVLFEGLTKQGSAADLIVSAWLAGLLNVYVSNGLAYEYESTLSNKLSPTRWQQTKPILRRILSHVQFVPIYYSWRPLSPDPSDEHVIDCALNANATVITANVRDFRKAKEEVGLSVLSPVEFVNQLMSS